MRIQAYTGETINIKLVIENLEVLDGVVAKFAVKGRDGTLISKDCRIEDNALLVTLDPGETMMAGSYRYEFRIRVGNEVDSLIVDSLVINESVIKEV